MNDTRGFIVLYRNILEWEWYDDINVTRVFIHLLLKANHKEQQWKGVEIGKGQLVTSVSKLAKQTSLSDKQVRIALDKLKRTSEIATQGSNKYTLITVVNWDKWQSQDIGNGEQKDKPQGKQKAIKGQTKGNQRATNNNENNENNENNIGGDVKSPAPAPAKKAYGEFENVLLTDEEYRKVKARIVDWEKLIESLSGYMSSTGKKYKSHYSTLLTWARRDGRLKSSDDVDLVADTMFTVPMLED